MGVCGGWDVEGVGEVFVVCCVCGWCGVCGVL